MNARRYAPAAAPALEPTRLLGGPRSAARAILRFRARRRFLSGWAALNPGVAAALRRAR